jgi:hypothetical protein
MRYENWPTSAHIAKGTTSKDARDVVEFLSVLLRITYDLPHQIKQYRARKGSQKRVP